MMNTEQKLIIELMAECDLRISDVAARMGLHRNTIVYHLDRIRRQTGRDPRRFYDLVKLLDTVREEARR